jgi:NAD(P)-dependent dehydrogenase (short-subunit alcohol dehydrogenase family)
MTTLSEANRNTQAPAVTVRACDCCLVSRTELAHLRANQRKPQRRRVILQTGARIGGIGHAIAMELALGGDIVIVAERDRPEGWEAVRDVRAHQGEAYFAHLDVSDQERLQRLMSVIRHRWGRLDAAIINHGSAGDPARDNFLNLDGAGFRKLLEDNLVSAFLVARAVLPFFLRQPEGGTCIFLGSGEGQSGMGASQVGYATAKTALSALVRAGATQHSGAGCRFVLVRPGLVKTRSSNWAKRVAKDGLYDIKEGKKVPMGRLGTPTDIAGVVAFLLRPEAAYVNGSEINVDGGLLASGNLLPGQASTDRDAYIDLVNLVEGGTIKAA